METLPIVHCVTAPNTAIAFKAIFETLSAYINSRSGNEIKLTFSPEGLQINEELAPTSITALAGFHVHIHASKFASYSFYNRVESYDATPETYTTPITISVDLAMLTESFKNFLKADLLELSLYRHGADMFLQVLRKESVIKSSTSISARPTTATNIVYPNYAHPPLSIDIKSFNNFCKTRVKCQAHTGVVLHREHNSVQIKYVETGNNVLYLYSTNSCPLPSPIDTKFYYSQLIKPTKFNTTTKHVYIDMEPHKPLRYTFHIFDIGILEIYISPKEDF